MSATGDDINSLWFQQKGLTETGVLDKPPCMKHGIQLKTTQNNRDRAIVGYYV
jgi:hypothetical protein